MGIPAVWSPPIVIRRIYSTGMCVNSTPRRFYNGGNAFGNAERYPPKIPVDFDALADMVSVLVDGGIIISKVLRDKEVLPKQIMLLRDYVRVIFLGT